MTEPTIEAEPRQCWIAGRPERGARAMTIRHPFDGTDVADVTVPDAEQIERAVAGAVAANRRLRELSPQRRAGALNRVADLLNRRGEEIAETITSESGKPWQFAEREVTEAVRVFRTAAVDAIGVAETSKGATGGLRVVRMRAKGPVLSIGSHTFPLAGPARQLASAIAAGAPVVVKPASATPLSGLLLGEVLADAALPDGSFSVLPLRGKDMAGLVGDPRLPVIAFDGSRASGYPLLAGAPDKQFVLAVGAATTAIVCPDLDGEADLSDAARRLAFAATAQAGQSRLAVRRVFVPQAIDARFEPMLVAAVRAAKAGSPHDPEVTVGPLINEEAAIRALRSVNEAIAVGATLLTGGVRDRATVTPTVLAVRPESATDEVLGPILLVSRVDTVDTAIELANATGRGLPVGVLTNELRTGLLAADRLDGDVVVGALPTEVPLSDAHRYLDGYRERQTVVLSGQIAGDGAR